MRSIAKTRLILRGSNIQMLRSLNSKMINNIVQLTEYKMNSYSARQMTTKGTNNMKSIKGTKSMNKNARNSNKNKVLNLIITCISANMARRTRSQTSNNTLIYTCKIYLIIYRPAKELQKQTNHILQITKTTSLTLKSKARIINSHRNHLRHKSHLMALTRFQDKIKRGGNIKRKKT